jgi:glutamate dehydrogenase/leucine dehydrogenase
MKRGPNTRIGIIPKDRHRKTTNSLGPTSSSRTATSAAHSRHHHTSYIQTSTTPSSDIPFQYPIVALKKLPSMSPYTITNTRSSTISNSLQYQTPSSSSSSSAGNMANARAEQIAAHLNYPKGMLHGQVAIITGSGQGIGAEAARLFANEGAKVVVSDIDAGE